MLNLSRNSEKLLTKLLDKPSIAFYSTPSTKNVERKGEFRVLNLKTTKSQLPKRRTAQPTIILPPRTTKMPTDQNWGNVWPGPRTFHPASVPLPVRQGFAEKGAPPGKFANAELMKIPNFLHLTPPVIQRQCEALKKFCTPWPKNLDSDEACHKHFPVQVATSDYCHSSPTIRDPLSRIVTVKFRLSTFKFNARAKDKFLRLVGERYDEETDMVTIVTDRCPTRKQNYDYAMYLITALYHESLNVEPWESLKSDADMERYDWEKSASKRNIEVLFNKKAEEVAKIGEYLSAVDNYMNEGENEYTISNYAKSVRSLLNLPS